MGTHEVTTVVHTHRSGRQAWFATLFMTDIWERFGFYGMQAILVLYVAAPAAQGGLGLSTADASALFGAWIGFSFLLSLPGGWIADRLLGARRTLLTGAIVGTGGYVCLALPSPSLTTPGLLLVAIGIGMYKPNHQALINMMFGDAARREAGIALIYIGVQLSALLAPLVTGYLGERVNWHLGFACAAIALACCAVQLHLARGQFGGMGEAPERPLSPRTRHLVLRRTTTVFAALVALVAVGAVAGVLTARLPVIFVGLLTIVVPMIAFPILYRNQQLQSVDRRRLRTFLWVFTGSALFWLIVAQDGSVLLLFARDSTDLTVFGFDMPASWTQSATPLFLIALAPVAAWRFRRSDTGIAGLPGKFSLGLILAGGSFLLMIPASAAAAGGTKVSPVWLLAVYLMHACGELIIAAVGVAAAADVLPRSFLSHTLGMWWLFAALGGGVGSQVVRLSRALSPFVYFGALGGVVTVVGLLMLGYRRSIVRGLTG
jgi:POT family proton-dependent oligopeptide transporter